MREIEFRGKSGRKWVYGNCIEQDKKNNTYLIAMRDAGFYPQKWVEVETNTIGQFTGMHDKNGKKIYEGDIVSQYFSITKAYQTEYEPDGVPVEFPIDGISGWHIGVVHYRPSEGFVMFPYIFEDENDGKKIMQHDTKRITQSRCEVVGNIYDNQELLEIAKEG